MDRRADAERRTLPMFAEPGVPLRDAVDAAASSPAVDYGPLRSRLRLLPPESARRLPAGAAAADADLLSLVTALVRGGVDRVRIAGGEPLLHPHLVEIVARVGAVPGVRDLALKANGTQLAALAKSLRAAALRRLNVSVDSLVPGEAPRAHRSSSRVPPCATAAAWQNGKSRPCPPAALLGAERSRGSKR